MDSKKQKLFRNHNNIGEAEDRISELPESLIIHILSFLDIKPVSQTSLLSKRWKYVWTSIPTLIFPLCSEYSLSETNKLMEFVDRTLLLHDTSNIIQKFHLWTNQHMTASRVHSWIESLIRRNIKELDLCLEPYKPYFIPSSLFTCESLIKLELSTRFGNPLPKNICFPKLKSLKLIYFGFTDDGVWNEQQFSNCPVLENLILQECAWDDVSNFCISIPALKLLEINNDMSGDDGLQDCALKIHAPNLVSLAYCGCVPKEFLFSSLPTLKSSRVYLIFKEGLSMEQKIGYGAAVRKFIRTLSCIQSLEIHAETLQTFSIVDDFVNILPTFHYLEALILQESATTDKLLFPLLKAVPNLRCLIFEENCIDDDNEEEHSWDGYMLTAGYMFQHLESVTFIWFNGSAREMRWVELILKNAKALRTIILDGIRAKSKQVIMSELLSLPRASAGCEFKIEE